MSSTLDQIRSIIQDKPVYQDDTFVLVAGQVRFQTKYYPIRSSPGDVIITGTAVLFTVTDPENGLITFVSAPGANVYGIQYSCLLLSDQTIQDFIDLEAATAGNDDIRIVAAMALDAIASQQALLLKRIKLLDLDVDGPALAKELRAHAKSLRSEAVDAEQQEASFEIAEQVNDIFGWREKITKDFFREET